MSEPRSEIVTPREVIADAIERGIRQQEDGWDACETCLGRVADVVIADLAQWASDNRTEAFPWEEHFVGAYGPWEYQFQHRTADDFGRNDPPTQERT